MKQKKSNIFTTAPLVVLFLTWFKQNVQLFSCLSTYTNDLKHEVVFHMLFWHVMQCIRLMFWYVMDFLFLLFIRFGTKCQSLDWHTLLLMCLDIWVWCLKACPQCRQLYGCVSVCTIMCALRLRSVLLLYIQPSSGQG